MVSNHDSRSPFFSLLSFNYSKALISASFHHQSASPNTKFCLEALTDALER